MLALSGELDYRSAHKVVGRAVRDLIDAGDPPEALTPERLAAAAEAVLGRPVEIDGATLRDALDPAACAAARRQTGSSSEAAMDAMLAEIDETLAASRCLERERTRARGGGRSGSARPRTRARRRLAPRRSENPRPLFRA